MDMQDPAQGIMPGEHTNPEVSAAAADASVNDAATEGAAAALDEEFMEADAEREQVKSPASADEVLAAAKALLELKPEEFATDQLRRLKQLFSMFHKKNRSADEDADEQHEPAVADELEAEFTGVIETLRARKAEWSRQQEELMADNLSRKNEIIEKIIALAEDTDNVNRTFDQYRQLQDDFAAIGAVPQIAETGVWKRFQEARERYSDNLKINKELRDYDFRRNLVAKEALLAEAEALTTDDDVLAAYRRLQDLHNRWRLIGPVAKELRDEIWNKFRDFSAEINKRYQAYFEERKAREAENEAAKTALCECIEALDFSTNASYAAWDEMTKQILALQEEWKKLGFASKKANRQLFNRFRNRCDEFFSAKAEYFRSSREEMSRNLATKTALAERAEALADSTDWRATADELVKLQQQWKAVGAVPKKHSDSLWKRFTDACDKFFDAKKKANGGARQAESANLRAKREIIGQLSAIVTDGLEKTEALAKLNELRDRWKEIGHVPFREKDKLYEAYRSAIDEVRRHFDMVERGARRARFADTVKELEGDDRKISAQRERLVRALEARKAELRTYENNLGFLSSRSKSGNNLVSEMEARIERLKADIDELAEKVKMVDSALNDR